MTVDPRMDPGAISVSTMLQPCIHRAFLTDSPAHTEALGEVFASHVQPGDVLALSGNLGAGKTCFVRGLSRGLGSPDLVTSPTFVLLHTYETDCADGVTALHHFDLYRLSGDAELEDIGGADLLEGSHICVVEWAERASASLPDSTLNMSFEILGETSRRVTCTGPRTQFEWVEAACLPDTPKHA